MKHFAAALLILLWTAAPAAAFEQYFIRDIPSGADRVSALTFTADGRLMAWGTDGGRVTIMNVADGSLVFSTQGHDRDVTALKFDTKGDHLVSGSRDDDIIIWNIPDGDPLKSIDDFGNHVTCVDISPDNRYVAACGSKRDIMVWEYPSGFLRGELKGHDKDVIFCAFNADGTRLVSVGEDRAIIVWDLKSLGSVRRNDIAAHTLPNSGLDIVSAAMSDDRRFLAVGIEEHVMAKGGRGMEFRHNIAFYDWRTGTLLKVLEGNTRRVERLALSPDVTCLLTDNSPMHGHEFAVWDILGGAIEISYPIDGDITGFDMSADGRYLAAAFTKEDEGAHIALWEITGIAGYTPPASGTATPLAETGFGGTISLTGPENPVLADASSKTMAALYLDAYGIDDGIARIITEDLEGKLVNSAPCVAMLERNQIDRIVQELKYAESGMTDQRAIEIGKHLEAEYLLYGSVRKMAHDLTVTVKVVHVESGRIIGSRGVQCTNASLRDIFDMIAYLAPAIAACDDQ